MIAVVSLLLVVALSLMVVRVGAVALMMTGLSEEIAQFQSLSAFSGTGFTTGEAEALVKHPHRRRVVTLLIRLGSAGVVTAISTLLLTFIGAGQAVSARVVVLLLGGIALIGLAQSRSFNRVLTPLIERALARYTTLDLRDYADLLHLHEDYRIVEIDVEAESWLVSRQLEELSLPAEGVRLLGVIRPEGDYIGAPPPGLRLRPGDSLIVYGREHRLQELSIRRSGDQDAQRVAQADHQRDLALEGEKWEGSDVA